jgi:hypothetical protein
MENKNNINVMFIESPYSGDIDRNIRYLHIAMSDSGVLHNECPYASHAYMTQHPRAKNYFVSDYDNKWNILTRESAIERSQEMRRRCNKTVFYTDRGWSRGMKDAKDYCIKNNLPYEERTVDISALSKKIFFLNEEFCRAVINDKSYDKFLE